MRLPRARFLRDVATVLFLVAREYPRLWLRLARDQWRLEVGALRVGWQLYLAARAALAHELWLAQFRERR